MNGPSHFHSRMTEDLAEDRELAAQQAAPARASSSETLRRCQPFAAAELKGLKRAG